MTNQFILTALLALASIPGSFAQKEINMDTKINSNAPVKCSKSILINAGQQKVWSILSNIDDWDSWQTDISKSKLKGELKPNTSFDWKTGGVKIHSTLHTVKPNEELGWTGKTFGMKAIHNWILTSEKGQTKVSVDESMEGFLAGLFKRSFQKNLEKGMEHWLELLKATCEK